MKVPDSIKIHGMDEVPSGNFRYIFKEGGIGIDRERFNNIESPSAS